MGGFGASLKLAGVRVRRRPSRAVGPLLGIALVAAFAGGVAAEGTIAADQASHAVLAHLSPLNRTVRVTWQGVVTPDVQRRARELLAGLGLGDATEVVLMNPVRLGGVVVRPAAISPLSPWVAGPHKPPPRCHLTTCPMLLARGGAALPPARVLSSAGVRLTVAGQVTLSSAAPLGFVPEGPEATPVLVTADVSGLESVPGLTGIYRTHTWLTPLPASHLESWQLAAFERRLQRSQQALVSASSSFALSAPFGALDAARTQAGAAPRRLLLAGGGALAALILFIVLVVGGLRADTDGELRRLQTAGARPSQYATFVAAESGLVCAGALLVGGLLAVAAAAVLAGVAGVPVGGVLTHTVLTPAGAEALIGAWLGATTLLTALLLISPGTGVANAAAVAAVAALALALAEGRGGSASDPLPVLLAPLCCAAAGVLVFRGAGIVLRTGERVARNGPLPVRLAFVGLARAPGLPSLSIAFVAVAMGLGGFALCYRATLLRGTSDEAANAVPLDAIVAAGPDFRTPLQVAAAARWNAISGGVTWPVNRTEASFVSGSGTVTVPALGIPAGVLPRLHGWRSGDGSASLPALARRLRPSSTVRTDGPALPAAASILAITTVGSSVSATLEADLRDGRGDIRRVALGETGANGPRTLEARVPATPHGPWTLEALVFGEPAGLQSTGGHQNAENPAAGGAQTGTIRVGPLTTLDAARRPLERVDLSGWRAVGAAAVAHGAAAAGSPAARPGALDLRFSETGSVGVARPAQPSDTHPVPVLVDAATASAAGPGGSLGLTVNGEPVSARVAGVLKRFPTVPDGSAGFVVADQATLASALDAQLPGQGSANEIWISTRDPSRVRQALGAGPFTQLRGSFRGSVEQLLRAAPVARAVAGTLIAAAGLSAVLAIVGLLFAMLGGARSRVAERDLVTQGIGPRGLRRELRVRLGVAGASGVIAGLLIALLLTRLAVATVRAAGTLATPQPPLITVTPADQLALWAIAGLVALGAAAFIATLATGRRP